MPIVRSHSHSESAKAFGRIVRVLLEKELQTNVSVSISQAKLPMKIAVPVTGGLLSSHFGHCDHFALYDVDEDGKTIVRMRNLTPPPHEPGTFPKWLRERGATVIIAGGMGSRAQSLFQQNSIETVVGASSASPDELVRQYLAGELKTGANVCDH
jgi:predicted Fe-Mo cluster-binding NifX family protein